jgi:ribosomal protein S8
MNKSLINLLIQLKNKALSLKEVMNFPYNKQAFKLVEILYREGLIQSYKIIFNSSNKKYLQIKIRYRFGKAIFRNLIFISRPSNHRYLKLKDLYKFREKKRIIFLSTSKGFLTSLDCKKMKTGGKILFVS